MTGHHVAAGQRPARRSEHPRTERAPANVPNPNDKRPQRRCIHPNLNHEIPMDRPSPSRPQTDDQSTCHNTAGDSGVRCGVRPTSPRQRHLQRALRTTADQQTGQPPLRYLQRQRKLHTGLIRTHRLPRLQQLPGDRLHRFAHPIKGKHPVQSNVRRPRGRIHLGIKLHATRGNRHRLRHVIPQIAQPRNHRNVPS